jgi:hypothetical protein
VHNGNEVNGMTGVVNLFRDRFIYTDVATEQIILMRGRLIRLAVGIDPEAEQIRSVKQSARFERLE